MFRVRAIIGFLKTYLEFLGFGVTISLGAFAAVTGLSYIFIGDYEASVKNGFMGFVIAFWIVAVLAIPASIISTFLTMKR